MRFLIWGSRNRVLRALFSLIVGSLILMLNNESYDTRFSIRTHRAMPSSLNLLVFKDTTLVNEYLKKLKKQSYSKKELFILLEPANRQFYKNDVLLENLDTTLISLNSPSITLNNSINIRFTSDSDGILRRIQMDADDKKTNKLIINYTAHSKTIETLHINGLEDLDMLLKSKNIYSIIISKNKFMQNKYQQTPLGKISSSEFLTTIVDNIINDKWLKKIDFIYYIFYLLLIIIISTWIILSYPHSVSFVVLIWLATFTSALSLWLFDTFYIWFPILSPSISIGLIYFTFLSHELSRKEHHNLILKNKQKLSSELEELKDNFISLISHDLKTPIAKIQGITNKLIIENSNSEIQNELKNILSESEELDRYIKSIIRLSKLESKNIKLDLQSTDINQIILTALTKVQYLADQKNIKLCSELEPIFLTQFDPTLIYEVVLNLLENSIKYNDSGGTTTIYSSETNNEIVVMVEDDGHGISKKNQNFIFDKFKRVDKEHVTTKGTGLGLYLVKYFVELHKGEVFVESSHKKGTSIGFTLPIQ